MSDCYWDYVEKNLIWQQQKNFIKVPSFLLGAAGVGWGGGGGAVVINAKGLVV